MGKILIVEDDKGVSDILAMIVESRLGFQAVLTPPGPKAISLLNENRDIEMVLRFYEAGNGKRNLIYQHVSQVTSQTPVLLSSVHEADWEQKVSQEHGALVLLDQDSVVRQVGEILQINNHESKESETFYRINIFRFLSYSFGCLDIYITKNGKDFERVYDFTTQKLEDYLNQGIDAVYLKARHYETFVAMVLQKLLIQINRPDLPVEEQLSTQLKTLQEIHHFIHQLGVKPLVAKATEATISSITTLLKGSKSGKKLWGLLEDLKAQHSYLYAHSHLTAYLAMGIIKETVWKEHIMDDKLVFAALFQNISLKNDREAMVQNRADLMEWVKDNEGQKRIRMHMFEACKILEGGPYYDQDVGNMIHLHHESPDGSGIPRGLLSYQFSPLQAVFHVSCRLSHDLLVRGIEEKSKILREYQKWAIEHPFDEVLKAAHKCLALVDGEDLHYS